VLDGWSIWVVLDELRTLYAARVRNVPASLPRPGAEYQDFVRWQLEMIDGPEGARLWEYWRRELAGELPTLDVPLDKPRPPVQTFNGASRKQTLDAELIAGLRDLARAEGTTPYVTFLTGFHALLHRYSHQSPIVVGSPVFGRTRGEFHDVVGDFISMLPVIADVTSRTTFRRLLGQVRTKVVEGLNYQDFPFSLMVERMHVRRDSSRSPIFQASFIYNKPQRGSDLSRLFVPEESPEPLKFGELQLAHYPLGQQEGQFDLTMDIGEVGDHFAASLRYNADLFEVATIDRMLDHYLLLLRAMVSDPDVPVGAVSLITEEEVGQLAAHNRTAVEYGWHGCIHELFEAQAGRTPQAIALEYEGSLLTYADLDARANQLAHELRSRGVGPEVPVGICAERSLELVIGLLGILKAGGAYVPLDPSHPRQRLSFMQRDCGMSVVLAQAGVADALAEPGVTVLLLDAEWSRVAARPTTKPASGVTADHLAYIIYTSGSTGTPKGAMNAHRAVCNRLLWFQSEYRLGADDVLLQKTPFSFDVSVGEFFGPLLAGARLVLARPGGHKDPEYLVDAIARSGVTTVHFVPSMLRVFLDAPGLERCARLRRVFCSGEALTGDLQCRFFERVGRHVELNNLYGPTEAAIEVTAWRCRPEDGDAPVPIGRPIANCAMYIVDDWLHPVPPGMVGELCIGGVQVGRGYLGRPQLTAERFVADPFSEVPGARMYRTGDLAKLRSDGAILYLGRLDFQVKIRGFRIELGEIEAELQKHPAVRQAVVAVAQHESGDHRLVAYVVFAAGEEATTSELRKFLRQQLPDYFVPSLFVPLDAIPLTESNKVNRRALPSPLGVVQSTTRRVPPRTPAEEAVAAIWREVLGTPDISVHDNFFEAGGHSLLSLKVIARIEQQMGVRISAPRLMMDTLEQIALACDPGSSRPAALTGSAEAAGDVLRH
jgi:amino acid adenylation domain-containing protein